MLAKVHAIVINHGLSLARLSDGIAGLLRCDYICGQRWCPKNIFLSIFFFRISVANGPLKFKGKESDHVTRLAILVLFSRV